MAKYDGLRGPTDYRFEIHAGFFNTNMDRNDGDYDPYGSYMFVFETNDEEQAHRIYESIYNYSIFRLHDSITGLYLHEKTLWYDGTYHPELDDSHAIDLDWFFEDNLSGFGEFFPIAIYEQTCRKEN